MSDVDIDPVESVWDGYGLPASAPVSSGITARELMAKTFPPIKFVVPGYVVEGLTIFAGAPKLGKSWAVLDWALAVASGGYAFGSILCQQGDVKYCALEDNHRRLQSRMKQMGIKVVRDEDGGPVSTGQAILRLVGYWVSGFVFYLGYIWILIDKRRRGWFDLIAGTCVVKA